MSFYTSDRKTVKKFSEYWSSKPTELPKTLVKEDIIFIRNHLNLLKPYGEKSPFIKDLVNNGLEHLESIVL